MKTEAEKFEREVLMNNAAACAVGICQEAQMRGLSGYDVAVALASIVSALDPTLSGKALIALGDAIRLNPVTKVITPEPPQIIN